MATFEKLPNSLRHLGSVLDKIQHLDTFLNYFVRLLQGRFEQTTLKMNIDTVPCPTLSWSSTADKRRGTGHVYI